MVNGPVCGQVVCSPGESCWSHWKESKEEASNHPGKGSGLILEGLLFGFGKSPVCYKKQEALGGSRGPTPFPGLAGSMA